MNNMNDNLFKMNLQLFADEPETDASSDGAEDVQSEEQTERTFTQAELDTAIANRLSRYKRDEAKRIEEARAAGRSEAEKLAKMTEQQRAEHDREAAAQAAKAREDAIAQREAEITRRELRATAIDTLNEKKIPTDFVDFLNLTDADACSESITKFEQVWNRKLQEAITERLKTSGTTLRMGGDANAALLAQMRKAAGLNN